MKLFQSVDGQDRRHNLAVNFRVSRANCMQDRIYLVGDLRGAKNAGVENAGVENTGAKTYGKLSEQKIKFASIDN